MKKLILSLAAFSAMSASFAQTRLALYEEFTGENCYPCSQTNPGLDALMNASGNDSKVLMIKFMEPIPTVGIFYFQNKAQNDARASFYSLPFTPYGRMDGIVLHPSTSSPGHPGYLTQADIDAEAAVPANFNISVTGAWNSTYDSVTANVTVTCVTAYTGTNIKLRTALVETVNWPVPPSTAGLNMGLQIESKEKDFDHVVRRMYPDATGTSASGTWTVGATQTFTIKGAVPNYVDRNGNPFLVVWLQDDGILSSTATSVLQTAKSAPLTAALTADVAADSINNAPIYCTSATPSVAFRNAGTTTLTDATIYYKLDNGSWASQAWTGSLAAGASTSVALSTTGVTPGTHVIYDSVVTTGDVNTGNANSLNTFIQTKTGYDYGQVSTNFEASLPTGYIPIANPDGSSWSRVWSGSTTTNLGHNGSKFAMYCDNPDFPAGEASYLIIPTPTISGTTTLDFSVAYAQQTASSSDRLDVVYSTDCGSTWTSIWNKSGADLATAAMSPILNPGTSSASGYFIPTTNADWVTHHVDITSVPSSALIAFKNTSNGGNYIFLDDVIATPYTLNVNNVNAAANIALYPNPAKDAATLEFTLATAGNVQITVVDVIGRTVATVANGNMSAGTQKVQINTADLAAGVYTVKVSTDNGVSTERLTVVK